MNFTGTDTKQTRTKPRFKILIGASITSTPTIKAEAVIYQKSCCNSGLRAGYGLLRKGTMHNNLSSDLSLNPVRDSN